VVRGNILQRHRAAADTQVADTQVLDGGDQERMVTDRDLYRAQAWPEGVEPSVMTAAEPVSARVSTWAGLGLIVSVVGLCAALTGLLAPEGAALGVLGFLFAIGGVVASRRPAVAGGGLAGLAMIIAVVAVVLAVLAMSGRYSVIDSRTNEITMVHGWLVGHWAWLGRW
jgi:hypothetical protein